MLKPSWELSLPQSDCSSIPCYSQDDHPIDNSKTIAKVHRLRCPFSSLLHHELLLRLGWHRWWGLAPCLIHARVHRRPLVGCWVRLVRWHCGGWDWSLLVTIGGVVLKGGLCVYHSSGGWLGTWWTRWHWICSHSTRGKGNWFMKNISIPSVLWIQIYRS